MIVMWFSNNNNVWRIIRDIYIWEKLSHKESENILFIPKITSYNDISKSLRYYQDIKFYKTDTWRNTVMCCLNYGDTFWKIHRYVISSLDKHHLQSYVCVALNKSRWYSLLHTWATALYSILLHKTTPDQIKRKWHNQETQ